MRFRDRLARFMYGRYGIDEFYKFLTVVLLALITANFFFRSLILSIVVWLLWGYTIYRFFSRRVYIRQCENRFYLRIKNGIKRFFTVRWRKWKERKTHAYKKCPHCKATLRLPRVKGKHGVNCPKCKKHFEVNI